MNKLLLVADSVVANTWDVFRNVSDPYNLESRSRINKARSISAQNLLTVTPVVRTAKAGDTIFVPVIRKYDDLNSLIYFCTTCSFRSPEDNRELIQEFKSPK